MAPRTWTVLGLVCIMTTFFIHASASSAFRLSHAVPRFPTFSGASQGRAFNKINSIMGKQWEGSKSGYNWSTAYFTQTLDHFSFSPKSYQTFQQKYILWDEAWAGAEAIGPIFVYCGNEGPVEWFANNAGFIREIAPEFGALVVAPEHRYYGVSMPFGSAAAAYEDADSLAYLTTEQAMADYAVLLTDLKRNLSAQHSPVVLFGGSYGGMIAAWFRLKYPHIAIGAIASSAPILQFGDLVPPDTFYRIVSEDFRRESESCFEAIRSSWDAIAAVGSTADGLRDLSAKFHMCRPLQAAWELRDWLESAYSYLAMVDYPLAADFLMPLPAYPIRELCKAVDGLPEGSPLLERIFAGVSVYYNYTGTEECFDLRADPHGMSGWDFQYCTEMVMPLASNASNSMFEPREWDLAAVEASCEAQFGVRPRPNWVLTQFGGTDMKSVLRHFGSNLLFSNGALDPWSGGSVLEDINPSVLASIIPDGAHHLDLRPSTPHDPISVINQRMFEKAQIRRWLREYYEARGLATRAPAPTSVHLYAAAVAMLAVLALVLGSSGLLLRRSRSHPLDRGGSNALEPTLCHSLIPAPATNPTDIPEPQTLLTAPTLPNSPNHGGPQNPNSPNPTPHSPFPSSPASHRSLRSAHPPRSSQGDRVQRLGVGALVLVLLLPAVAGSRAEPGKKGEVDLGEGALSLPKDLVASTFNSSLEATAAPWALVEFFASWCPACQHFKPHYERVARLFTGPSAPYPGLVFFARVDCADQGALCQRFEIGRYPTMLFGKPSALAAGSRKGEASSEGLEGVDGGYAASSVLAWIAKRLDRKFSLDVEVAKKAGGGEGVGVIRGATGTATLPLGQSRATLHDVEEATALAFRFIFSAVKLTPAARTAMGQWVHMLASHHPSAACRKGSANLLAALDDLWPFTAAAGSPSINIKGLQTVQICGPDLPRGYWKECKGSKAGTRGYSCGLWLLFHSLSVRLDDAEGSRGLTAVLAFVEHFFGCGECRDHFLAMAKRLEMERAHSRREAILWLWKAHNVVNHRLAKEEEESEGTRGDPAFPKQQWPSGELCPLCRRAEADQWDEDQVLAFLVRHFEHPLAEGGSANTTEMGGGRKGVTAGTLPEGEVGSTATVPVSAVLILAVGSVGFLAAAGWWRLSHKRRKLTRRRGPLPR